MFGDRKNGREPIAYPHPLLEDVLAETYGIFVYQEQVMQAAQILAGYQPRRGRSAAPRDGQEDPGGDGRPARGLRRGLRAVNDIPAAKANELFDLIDKFAGYGFNKSPRRRLCAARLSDRVAEGALSATNSTPPRCAST